MIHELFAIIPKTIASKMRASKMMHAATIESVHRWYYDHVGLDERDLLRIGLTKSIVSEVGDALGRMWNILPDWRHHLKTGIERYDSDCFISSLPIHVKPGQGLEKLSVYSGVVTKCETDNFHQS